jgi:DNA-binding HxlR family transcriptional regulator
MASPVGYQTFCPVGAALNVVGERWALLIVRDLMLGPRRYSELQKGLGGIPTDILAARLRSLQQQSIVRQVGQGRAQRYELTESGQALGPVLKELGRWGADRLRLPDDPTEIPTRVPLTSLLLGGAPYPRQANGAYEVRVEDESVRVKVDAGQLHAAPDSEPDTTIELTRSGMRSLILGAPASEIEQAGDLSIRGSRRRADALLKALTGPARLAALRPQLEAAAANAKEGRDR